MTVTGTAFTGATAVKFNGTAAVTFSVVSATSITAKVPAGATTGTISVTTPSGTASSSAAFTVTVPAPTITGFSPASGVVGASVTITGTNLTGTSVVGFNGHHPTSFTVNAAGTQIMTTVPSGATTGKVAVIAPGGEAFSSASFTVIGPPTVTGFSPASSVVGASVTITGTNFEGATVVGFNGHHPTSFTVSPDGTTITTTVPSGATTGTVGVITPVGEAFSSANFTVIGPPAITSFAPTSGSVGTSVTITGTNFTGATSVAFNGTPAATFAVASGTSITATVPAGATTGTIAVTTPGGTAASTSSFTVTILASPVLSLTAAVNGQSSLSWTSVSNASTYNLYRSTTNGSGYVKIAASATTTTYFDQGLNNGTNYYYCVTSVNSSGMESTFSNQITSQPTAQAFGFLNVGNGSVLSGQLAISISMASRAYGSEANPVTFSVDGTAYDMGGDQQQSSGNAGANTNFVLATDAFVNGSHTLMVADTNGNSSSINVTFSNVLYNISIPNMFDTSGGDGLPTSATISASLTSAQPWTVSIVTVDSANSTVQSFSGNSANIDVLWNGKNTQGVEVDDDAYEVDISYGSSGQTLTERHDAIVNKYLTPSIGGTSGIRRNLLSKNKVGDCFAMLDEDVFPSYDDMIAYVRAIKADLAPSKGIVWTKFSFISHSSKNQWKAGEITRIDNHFKRPLTVFYVDAHGGAGFYGGLQFTCGFHYWESTDHVYSSKFGHSILPTLTQSANYGVANPPALVFIDACDSAGTDQSSQDLSFANDFDIGDGPSGYLGWDGFAVAYDAPGSHAPYDDWTFWRLDLWSQFTNYNQTYTTAYSNLQRDYATHGHNATNPSGQTPDQIMVTDWPGGSAF